jgi:hypothetical protein
MRIHLRHWAVALALVLGSASGCGDFADSYYGACAWPTERTCENDTTEPWCAKTLGEWHRGKSCGDLGLPGCTPPFCAGD